MSTGPLPIRKNAQNGALALRDGLVFALFMRKSHRDLGEAVGALLDRYLAGVGPKRMTLIHDTGEQYRPLTPARMARLKKNITLPSDDDEDDFMVTLRDGTEPVVPDHYFQYFGCVSERKPAEASYVEIWFPTEYLDEVGVEAFVAFLAELAATVPFSSGYCSLALNYEDWAVVPATPLARATALRYPGIDIHGSSSTSLYIGDGARGAYWLTFLGPEPLAILEKDAAALRAELGGDVGIVELRNGVLIRAGERPETGDVNRNERLPLVRKVAEAIEPAITIQQKGILFGDVDEFVKWQRRHLT
jgi:Type VI immunity for VRR-NUC